MKKLLSLVLIYLSISGLRAQEKTELSGAKANEYLSNAKIVRLTKEDSVLNYIEFNSPQDLPVVKLEKLVNQYSPTDYKITLIESSIKKDALGKYVKYDVLINNTKVDGAFVKSHLKGNLITKINLELFSSIKSTNRSISFQQAIDNAKEFVGAKSYKWEIESEENFLKKETNNRNATFYPKNDLVFVKKSISSEASIELAYKLDIYAHSKPYRATIYVSASSGEILLENKRIVHADETGTAVTKYSGTQTIVTDNTGSEYRLRESGRGNGIQTFNMLQGTSYGNAVDFTDDDNVWNNVNAQFDEIATDAHWGAEMTYDYFLDNHNQNSYDGNGAPLRSYLHYDVNYNNAFWDGQRMTYGDGSNNNSYAVIDVVGHEITHGLIQYTANLIYQDEPGALNESFADIFGACIEHMAKPASADWLMGEDRGNAIRNMQNPKQFGQPNTYLGQYWYTGEEDNGGVHYNSGVQNYWFYLLTNGGSGTNDLGNSYTVNGIGIDKASNIAFRNLSVYLSQVSDHYDARYYAIQSAIDLYGACSPEVEAVTNAWYAVGLGNEYVDEVVAEFTADLTESCQAPFTVDFNNLSINGSSFVWNFSDGTSSTEVNPTKTFNSLGEFDVELIADGGTCGTDTESLENYISINTNNECLVILNANNDRTTQTNCSGRIVDDGGLNGNYTPSQDRRTLIEPDNAEKILLDFTFFDIESGDNGSCNYDKLRIYRGNSISGANLLAEYCNTNLPPENLLINESSITIRFISDQGLEQQGFEIKWQCSNSNLIPEAQFESDVTSGCSPIVNFTDLSLNTPTNWIWDFGDGEISNLQNPVHEYQQSGIYSVKLIAENQQGKDSIVKNGLININIPPPPSDITITPTAFCRNSNVSVEVDIENEAKWYDSPYGSNSIYTGNIYESSSINTDSVIYVENFVEGQIQNIGMSENENGGAFFNNPDQYLIFTVFNPIVLKSVKVYAQGAGIRTVQLRDENGLVLNSIAIDMANGESRVNLNFEIPAGVNYQLGFIPLSEPNLYRNNSGVSFPYTIPGLMSITTSSAGTNPLNYYYWFYDWEVKPLDCHSPRVEVRLTPENCTSVKEEKLIQFEAYPNPVKETLTIKVYDSRKYKWKIIDLSGKIIIKGTDKNLKDPINLNPLSKGVYIFEIESDSNKERVKILKE